MPSPQRHEHTHMPHMQIHLLAIIHTQTHMLKSNKHRSWEPEAGGHKNCILCHIPTPPQKKNPSRLKLRNFFGLPCSVSGRRLPWEGRKSDTFRLFMKNHSQRQWTLKQLEDCEFFFISKIPTVHVSFHISCEHSLKMRLIQCQGKRRKSKNPQVLMVVLMKRRLYTQCFSVFFVHFVYLLGHFSDVNIGSQPPSLYKPP